MRRVRAPDTEIRCDLAVASRSLPMRTGARGLRGVLIRRMIGERYRRGRRAPAFRPFRSHSLAPVLNHHGRDERLLVRASESSRYSYSEGRASRPRHAATRCDRRAAVMERIVWGRHSRLPRSPAQTGMSAPLSTPVDSNRYLSPPVDLEDEDEMALFSSPAYYLPPRRLSVATKRMATKCGDKVWRQSVARLGRAQHQPAAALEVGGPLAPGHDEQKASVTIRLDRHGKCTVTPLDVNC